MGRVGVGFINGKYLMHCDNDTITYPCVYHLHPQLPDPVDHLRYVDSVFLFYLLQNMVDGNEDASTTNSSTGG